VPPIGKPEDDRRRDYVAAEPPLVDPDPKVLAAGMQIDPAIERVGLGVESHQVSSSWKSDTSGSISNRYAPRGSLDEYHDGAEDAPSSVQLALLASSRRDSAPGR